jgi:hypothetical protein
LSILPLVERCAIADGADDAVKYVDVIDAPSPADPNATIKLGLRSDTLRRYQQRSLATVIAQYYGIVRGISAQHLFRGLRRPMSFNGDMGADQRVLVYTWRSLDDFVWSGDRFSGEARRRPAPPGAVFVVIAREHEAAALGIHGSIERWNWVEEDPNLPQAPLGWEQRYGKKLWSRQYGQQ